MSKKAVFDEFGCELTKEELEDLDRKAKEITEEIFGYAEPAEKGAVPEKKKPGRPKRAPEEKKSGEIPQIVRDVIEEKIDILERMIGTYDRDIASIREELTQQITEFEDRKKDAAEKITQLSAYLGGR